MNDLFLHVTHFKSFSYSLLYYASNGFNQHILRQLTAPTLRYVLAYHTHAFFQTTTFSLGVSLYT